MRTFLASLLKLTLASVGAGRNRGPRLGRARASAPPDRNPDRGPRRSPGAGRWLPGRSRTGWSMGYSARTLVEAATAPTALLDANGLVLAANASWVDEARRGGIHAAEGDVFPRAVGDYPGHAALVAALDPTKAPGPGGSAGPNGSAVSAEIVLTGVGPGSDIRRATDDARPSRAGDARPSRAAFPAHSQRSARCGPASRDRDARDRSARDRGARDRSARDVDRCTCGTRDARSSAGGCSVR